MPSERPGGIAGAHRVAVEQIDRVAPPQKRGITQSRVCDCAVCHPTDCGLRHRYLIFNQQPTSPARALGLNDKTLMPAGTASSVFGQSYEEVTRSRVA